MKASVKDTNRVERNMHLVFLGLVSLTICHHITLCFGQIIEKIIYYLDFFHSSNLSTLLFQLSTTKSHYKTRGNHKINKKSSHGG